MMAEEIKEGDILVERPRLRMSFRSNYMGKDYSQKLFEYLEHFVPWGRDITPGRRVNANYGDPGVSYTLNFGGYGGKPLKSIVRTVRSWDELPFLKELRDHISLVTQAEYNYVVIQRYPNGRVGIKKHQDKEMKKNTTIAGISLGATRYLVMEKSHQKLLRFQLNPGSLYVFHPPTNEPGGWTHSIEKDTGDDGVRISLTFRLMPVR